MKRAGLSTGLRGRAAGNRLLQVAGTFVAFVLLNEFSVQFIAERGVSAFYPVAAVNVVAWMEFGVWGAIGVFLGKVATPWPAEATIQRAVIGASLNVLYGLIPWLVFKLRKGLHSDLRDGRSLAAFVVFGAVVNSAVGAIAGNFLLIPPPSGHLVSTTALSMWWVSDFSATIVLGIPLLAFASPLFARLRGETHRRVPRTIVNAVQVTGVVILLGWLSSSLVGNWLVGRIETVGLDEQRTWARASSLLSDVERDVVDARAVAIEGRGGAPRAVTADRLAELRRATGATLDELAPSISMLPANDRILFDDITRSVRAYVGNPLASSVDGNDLDRSIVMLRNSIEAATSRSWNDYRERRDRIDVVSFMTEQLVLLVFFAMAGYLIVSITGPLGRMQREVDRMRRGATFDASAVDTSFVDLVGLAEALETTSRALAEHQDNLRVQTRRALAASKAKTDFLAKMSHELRTPLNAIIGFSDLLRESDQPLTPEKRNAFLDNISTSGRRLLKMINDLLDIAKIESGKLRLHLADVDLRLLVESSVRATEPLFSNRHQPIECDLGELPLVARVDAGRIEQAFINLLSNATKFSPPGAPVHVRAHADGSTARIEFADRGSGIARDKQELIFEEFEQLGTLDQKSEGTGLGLALVRRFIEAHEGHLELESEPGQGTTFTVVLPLWDGKGERTQGNGERGTTRGAPHDPPEG